MKDFKLLALFGLQCAQEAIAEQIELVEEAIAQDGHKRRARTPASAPAQPVTAQKRITAHERRSVSEAGREAIVRGQKESKIQYWIKRIRTEGGDPEVILQTSRLRLEVLKRLKSLEPKKAPSAAVTEARRRNAARMRELRAQQIAARRKEEAKTAKALEPKPKKSKAERAKFHPKDRAKWLVNVQRAAKERGERIRKERTDAAMAVIEQRIAAQTQLEQ